MSRALASIGCKDITIANDGKQTLEALTAGNLPDLILMDVQMYASPHFNLSADLIIE